MPRKFPLSPRVLSDAFWDMMLLEDEGRGPEKAALFARLKPLNALRSGADYNTGSISLSAAWCLYALVRFFAVSRIMEVGTFIGTSTLAMASGMDDEGLTGALATCDASNAIELPWDGRTAIRQFPKATSGDMLRALDGEFDLVFLDGRLQPEDLGLLEPLIGKDTIFALDDFEGAEKGVANLSLLRTSAKLRNHLLLYPPSRAFLERRSFTSSSLVAVLVPLSLVEVSRQG